MTQLPSFPLAVTAVCLSTCLPLSPTLLTATLFIKLRKGLFKLPGGDAATRSGRQPMGAQWAGPPSG